MLQALRWSMPAMTPQRFVPTLVLALWLEVLEAGRHQVLPILQMDRIRTVVVLSKVREMEIDSIPKINAFAKYFILAMAVVSTAMTIWLATTIPGQDAQGRYLVIVIIAGLVLLSCLLVPYMIRVASTRFSADGVEQIVFFERGRFLATTNLKWQSVERVSYKQLAYKLFGGNSRVLIYLGCFGDYQKVADFINERLPKNAVWG
ncbi:hypothetical protein [Dyella choica]|uniref:Uncharacterized protein n=1 Tax=Dyella choica TaxID=1927959 RepID=A0A432M8P0_9GAMM|nr:hypothetical protein [Dyella choica]RUL77616.1 hypothetical protein EKH80_06990 [Dyella choica]